MLGKRFAVAGWKIVCSNGHCLEHEYTLLERDVGGENP